MAKQWRILIIEGEEQLNWNMVNSLQKDGYSVRGVTGGSEAIRLLWGEAYDVVICDQEIPDTDGLELLQWLRNHAPATRVLMLGKPDSATTRTRALEMGAAGYLERPLDLPTLKTELRQMLHATGFSASLDSFDLLDVIQIITLSRKSIALVVSTGLEEQGILRFQSGELVSAEYGVLRGEEAFFALAAHKNGTVVQRPWDEEVTPNVTQPLSRLIFQALQYRSKYAEVQPASGEMKALRSPENGVAVAASFSSVALPVALQGEDEDDDRPFQFVAEEPQQPTASAPVAPMAAVPSALEQLMRATTPAGSALEQLSALSKATPAPTQQEWRQPASEFPEMQQSGSLHAITEGTQEQHQAPAASTATTPTQPAPATRSSALPFWLTEQTASQPLPVVRAQTGPLPTVPKAGLPAASEMPATPPAPTPSAPLPLQMSPTTPPIPQQASPVRAQSQASKAVWSEPRASLATTNLRKTKPEEALYTGRMPAIRPKASAVWQGSVVEEDEVGKVETLHSLAALKASGVLSLSPNASAIGSNGKKVAAPPAKKAVEQRGGTGPLPIVAPAPGASSGKRNYSALAAALQTLGYSVPGFIASAVVGLDGTPIAQVAVDDLELAPLCQDFSQMMRSVLQVLQQGKWEPYEHTLISTRTRHILLRLIGNAPETFQVLITARETSPTESLEALANVEAAIAAALR